MIASTPGAQKEGTLHDFIQQHFARGARPEHFVTRARELYQLSLQVVFREATASQPHFSQASRDSFPLLPSPPVFDLATMTAWAKQTDAWIFAIPRHERSHFINTRVLWKA